MTEAAAENLGILSKLRKKIFELRDRYFPKKNQVPELELELARVMEDISESGEVTREEGSSIKEIISRLAIIEQQVTELVSETLTKVSRQLGSNEGGFYMDPITGERFYLKFYRNPDQARVECVAKSIYKELGIRTADSEVVEVDGRIAIKSKEIKGVKSLYRDSLRGNPDVMNGFIADAFLGNWDVMGTSFDNVVQGEDGGIYRIDNGGSLIFRARGDTKDFPSNDVSELKTLLNPQFTTGAVFSGISPEEMRLQAINLINTLTDEVIIRILKESGLKGENLRKVAEGLVGRREFLRKHFGLEVREVETKTPTFKSRLRELLSSPIEREGAFLRKFSFLCDGSKIEDQEIGMIDRRHQNEVLLSFKLANAEDSIRNITLILETLRKKGYKVFYEDIQVTGGVFSNHSHEELLFSRWIEISYEGIVVKICLNDDSTMTRRVSIGRVAIVLPAQKGSKINPEVVNQNLNKIFQDIFQIDSGIDLPNESEMRNYRERRYRWFRKIPSQVTLTSEEQREIDSMVREEVVAGYTNYVVPGRHQRVERNHGEFGFYYTVTNPRHLIHILTNGLFSTTERYKRGLEVDGMSYVSDIESGGADYVFTRVVSERSHTRSISNPTNSAVLILDVDLLDRTDSFSYVDDKYGSTRRDVFENRVTVEDLVPGGMTMVNETMFKCGISLSHIKRVACEPDLKTEKVLAQLLIKENPNEINRILRFGTVEEFRFLLKRNGVSEIKIDDFILDNLRFKIIVNLTEAGISSINGVPIEEFVTTIFSGTDVIDISHGRGIDKKTDPIRDDLSGVDKKSFKLKELK